MTDGDMNRPEAAENLESEERLRARDEIEGPIMDRYLEALEAGDDEECRRCAAQIEWSPTVLLALKRTAGADFIRSEGYCTRRADAAFGEGWLDRPEQGFGNGTIHN